MSVREFTILRMRLLKPFQEFVASESAGGIILTLAAAAAFLWANTPFAHAYFHMKEMVLGFGHSSLQGSLEFWVNDGLMVIFFLLVGLEIKREMLAGELAGLRRAILPVVAAAGGMVCPAAIYALANWGTAGIHGWGIPMATDIAFALGVLSLVGRGVPLSLKVFLTALAIIDDLGAVLVIALFYSKQMHLVSLGLAAIVLVLCFVYGRVGGRRLSVFAALGVLLWYFMLTSGVHATVAGVLLALTIPLTAERAGRESAGQLSGDAQGLLQAFRTESRPSGSALRQSASEPQSGSPLQRLEHALGPWVAYAILPVFALMNAGVAVRGNALSVSDVTIGVCAGLLVGKPLGIVGFSWLATRTGLTRLPKGTSWGSITGVGLLGGIGFTMSLFINALAFGHSDLSDQAKLGVLSTSVLAAIVGLLVLRYVAGRRHRYP
jgi:NhaA family Na+:H+ antiporter